LIDAGLTRRRELDGRVGLIVFLAATTMLFAALLLAYAILRAQAGAWPPAGAARFPRATAGANTLALIAAGALLRRARATGARPWLAGAAVLGAAFLGFQAVLWRHLVFAKLGPGSGPLGDAFFALSMLHAAHVMGGVVALAIIGMRRISTLVLYWDFVTVAWLVVYVAVCWL
jgi:cytochrome c oxidase subunit III